jgi:uncharacterized membrane protein YidH (DUF202 family)
VTVDGPTPPSAFVERTALAWRRTGLTLFAVALGGAKLAQEAQTWIATALAGITAIVALAVVARAEQLLLRDHEPPSSRALLMAVVTGAAVLLAASGVAMALS